MKKKILVVSAYFFPDITPRSFRTTELIKRFVQLGHDVTLYIPFRSYDYSSFLRNYPIDIKFLTQSELKVYLPRGSSFFKRAFRAIAYQGMYWTEYPNIKLCKVIPKRLANEKGYDLLISIAAPHTVHWGCNKALRLNSDLCNKWIADCGDPYMGDSVSKRPFYFKWFEKSFCHRVDYITVPIESAIKAYYPVFQNKINVIPQGFNFEEADKYKKKNNNPIPTFAYAGTLYPGYRDLNSFVDFLKDINLEFKFIIYTPSCTLVDIYKSKLGIKVVVKGFQPRDLLLDELSTMDFLVNIQNKSQVQSPSKLIDYALVDRPVLSITDNIDKKTVNEFLLGNYERRFIFPNLEQYDIKNVADKFLSL